MPLDDELLKCFATLGEGRPGEPNQFLAAAIPFVQNHMVAKDHSGRPSLLLFVDRGETRTPPPLFLRHIEVHHDVQCQILSPTDTRTAIVTIVICRSSTHQLQELFLQMTVPFLHMLAGMPSRREVVEAISQIVELFRAMERPARKSIVGLWAELFLMDQASDVSLLLRCWHNHSEDRYDFNQGDQRIEVKATGTRVRRHHFRHEQLLPPLGTELFIASVFVESSGGGHSITDLIQSIKERTFHPDLQRRLQKLVVEALGEDLEDALDSRFDYELALHSISFYTHTSIPSICPPVPGAISEIQFVSDLSQSVFTPLEQLKALGGIFRAACPLG